MELFKTEEAALAYLKRNVPLEKSRDINLSQLEKKLFNTPESISEGHHEFGQEGNLGVSHDIIDSWLSFGKCHQVLKRDDRIEGKFKPIYTIYNLQISAPNFSYDINEHDKPTTIFWLPNLKMKESKLEGSYVFIDKREIYLINNDGFFDNPLKLLGFFHELGHIETRNPAKLNAENATIKTTISADGVKTEPTKAFAYELQREYDTNQWIKSKTSKLWEDLGLPHGLIDNYITTQQESYHEVARQRFLNPKSS